MEPCGFVRRKLRVSRTPQPLALYRHYPRRGAADDCRMTYHTRAARSIRGRARIPRCAIVAPLAMAADRCFASFEGLMRPGGMRPAQIRLACPALGRDRRLSIVRILGGGPCRYTCHAGSANDAHGA